MIPMRVCRRPNERAAVALLLLACPMLALSFLAGCARPGDEARPVTAATAAEEAAAAGEEAGTSEAPAAAEQARPALGESATERPAAADWVPSPPDGVWQVDEEGREYYLEPLPREHAAVAPDGSIRSRWGGIPLTVEWSDDEFHYYRIYRPVEVETRRPRRPEPPPLDPPTIAEENHLILEPFGEGLPASGQWRNGFVIVDLDGDGHTDIVHGPPRKGRRHPVILRGDGRGGFAAWREARFPSFPYDYGDVAVADFDGDGRLDLALGIHMRGVVALVQREGGRFELWNEGLDFTAGGEAGGTHYSSRAVAAADWDGDGRPDILALGEGPRLAASRDEATFAGVQSFGLVVYRNLGDGRWERIDQGTDERELFGDWVVVGDVDGDRRPDAITSTNKQGRRDLLHLNRGPEGWERIELDVRPSSYVWSVAAEDVDGDGRDEVAIGYLQRRGAVWFSGIDLLTPDGAGAWARRPLVQVPGRSAITALAFGDLDRDGAIDLVGLGGDGDLYIVRGDGGGGWVAEQVSEFDAAAASNCQGYDVGIADLDGDGSNEVVAAFAGEPSAMFAPHECRHEGMIRAWKVIPRSQGPAP